MSLYVSPIKKKRRFGFTQTQDSNSITLSQDLNFRQYVSDYICKLYLEQQAKTKIGKLIKSPIIVAVKVLKVYVYMLTWTWERSTLELTKKTNLNQVDNHYSKIASLYEIRHHIITNWHDTSWRRQISFDAAKFLKEYKNSQTPILLDICTGTGLSLEEIIKVFHSEGIRVKAYGLDYNNEMLKIANEQTLQRIRDSNLLEDGQWEIGFVRGNAEDLVVKKGKEKKDECFRFNMNSVDCITNLCGIGGIENQKLAFEQQLKILKPGGILIMHDMHRPIPDKNSTGTIFSRVSFLLKKEIWEDITVKFILEKLWAWNDPTLAFYVLPLVTYHDCEENKYYGFLIYDFKCKTEPWIFKLPLVSTAKIIVEKVEIDSMEHIKKTRILNSITTL